MLFSKIRCIFAHILDRIFRPLHNSRTSEMLLGKEKAIKLTRTMQEREHTLAELNKMEKVRNFLLDGGAIDAEGFVDYLSEIQ